MPEPHDPPTRATEARRPPATEPAEPLIVRRRDWLPSLVWLVPIVAALTGLVLVGQLWLAQGPTIAISFKTAEGLEAGRTKVKYKNVNIGEVKRIELSDDRSRVLVKVELTKNAQNFAVADTRFWVVRPRISEGGISGLGTVFSGAYIGVDAGKSAHKSERFVGLELPPAVTRDQTGRQFVLRAPDLGSLDIGSPVYYRRVQVGQVVAYLLDANGKGVTMRVFVNAPYDRFVTPDSRFWQASGIDVSADTGGIKIKTQSLLSIVLGGLAFQSPPGVAAGRPAPSDTVFTLAPDEDAAMRAPDGEPLLLRMHFDQPLRGLSPGARVDYLGLPVGQVKSIDVAYDPQRHRVRVPVVIELYPARLAQGFRPDAAKSTAGRRQVLDTLVQRGLRAQLRSGSVLTGQLYVALDYFPKAKPARIDWQQTVPEIPTEANSLGELQAQLSDIAGKLSKVPFDQIGQNLNSSLRTLKVALNRADTLFQQLDQQVAPQAKATLEEAHKAFNAAQQLLSEDAPLQQDARGALQQLQRATESLRALSDYLARHPEALLRGKPGDETP